MDMIVTDDESRTEYEEVGDCILIFLRLTVGDVLPIS
jgi:hypothetical protein